MAGSAMDGNAPAARKISLLALTGMVVGSMVGAGIFNLPARFGTATGPFGAIVAWLIAGSGMYMLARVFQFLAARRPDLDSGVFAYAKAGFGDYTGFLSAFGYWLSAILGNVFYWVLIGATLGFFFPGFGAGGTVLSIAVALVGIWTFHFLILRGIQEAAFINFVVTVAKLVPLLVAVIAMVAVFNLDQFTENFWGGVNMPEKPLIAQVRDTMLITVFVFIGIEGASVYSRYAKSRHDVGSATILGFVGVTGLMVAITLLPYGLVPRAEIAALRQPSLAGALEAAVGSWGTWFISVGVLISVLGAYLAWSLLVAEVPFSASRSGDMPRFLGRENANRVPANAMWVSNTIISGFVISTYWSADAFNFMLDMATVASLLPYLLVAGFGILLTRSAASYADAPGERRRDHVIAWIAAVYVVFMFVAAGLKYIVLVAVLYAPGTLLYLWARREQRLGYFKGWEAMILGVVLLAAAAGVYGLLTGVITP
jgi:arginine:ornithine antiporter/lysine permease